MQEWVLVMVSVVSVFTKLQCSTEGALNPNMAWQNDSFLQVNPANQVLFLPTLHIWGKMLCSMPTKEKNDGNIIWKMFFIWTHLLTMYMTILCISALVQAILLEVQEYHTATDTFISVSHTDAHHWSTPIWTRPSHLTVATKPALTSFRWGTWELNAKQETRPVLMVSGSAWKCGMMWITQGSGYGAFWLHHDSNLPRRTTSLDFW